ncbi:hypothetical protein [Roseomonas rosulenta]|uniref:hypothetical protein n=1 Tax=Roseomonas rosulenta TaxID=2748667 RepID=UPI0018DFFC21|nr:hypothetical protein [Roseomonas rosulenta]
MRSLNACTSEAMIHAAISRITLPLHAPPHHRLNRDGYVLTGNPLDYLNHSSAVV